MARDRPPPYGEGTFFIVARGPVPRDRCMARDRPSPYDEGAALFSRSAGACPPRALHGEGQALAYGEGGVFYRKPLIYETPSGKLPIYIGDKTE